MDENFLLKKYIEKWSFSMENKILSKIHVATMNIENQYNN